MRLVFVLAAFGTVLAMDIVVPAYFRTTTGWDAMTTAASQVSLTAIVNPGSGPGSVGDAAVYKPKVDALRAAGGTVIAYVMSDYTKRSLATIKSEIDLYLTRYTLDGFFVDETNSNASTAVLQYYQDLYSYIKAKNNNYIVMQNPGTRIPEIYLTSGTGDRFVTFESSQLKYGSYNHPAYYNNYPASTFVHLVYNATVLEYQADVDFAASKNVGGVYITNRTIDSNPWLTLPSYWDQEVAYVKLK